MKKNLRNHSGFTLVELLLAAGVVGVVSLIAFTSLRSSIQTGGSVYVTSESTYLKNLVVANLSNNFACENTFKGFSPTRAIVVLKDKRNTPFLSVNNKFGEGKRDDIITVTGISSTVVPGSSNNLTLKVTYDIDNTLKGNRPKNTNSFTLNVFYRLDTATGLIDNCLVNYSSLMKDAVKASCQGNAAYYEPVETLSVADQANFPSGRCTHRIHVLNNTGAGSDAAVVAGTVACPAGQFLVDVSTPSANPHDHQPVFKCQAMQASCAAGTYLQGIQSNGTPICKSMVTLMGEAPPASPALAVADGNAVNIVTVATTKGYQGINLNCGTNQVLRKVNADGTPDCVNKVITGSCPPGEFIWDVSASGAVSCRIMPKSSATCGSGSYIHTIFANGSFSCATNTFATDCGPTGAIRGVAANGAVTCY